MTKEEEIENGLTSPDLEVRKRFVEDDDIFDSLSDYQINRGLTDKNPLIRYICAKKCLTKENISDKQVLRGLMDENTSVRALFIRENNMVISDKHIESIIKDKSTEVLVSLALATRIPELTPQQKDIFINSPVKRIRDAFAFVDPCVDILSIEKMIEDSSINIRKLCASSCKSIFLPANKYYLERGLLDRDNSVRRFFGKKIPPNSINNHQLERFLTSKDDNIRELFAEKGVDLNDRQIKRGLNDSNDRVAAAFIRRNGSVFFLSREVVGELFNRGSSIVNIALQGKGNLFTSTQIEDMLNDDNPDIRSNLSHFGLLDDEQVERGLNDSDEKVVAAFISRKDAVKFLSQRKIKELFNRGSAIIKIALIEKSVTFADEQIESMLTDGNPDVRKNIAYFDNFIPTEEQINRALIDTSVSVRNAFIRRSNIKLSEEQIDIIIDDSNYGNVWGLLTRDDIALTSKQIDRLLEYPVQCVVNTLKERSDYIEYNKKESKTHKRYNRV